MIENEHLAIVDLVYGQEVTFTPGPPEQPALPDSLDDARQACEEWKIDGVSPIVGDGFDDIVFITRRVRDNGTSEDSLPTHLSGDYVCEDSACAIASESCWVQTISAVYDEIPPPGTLGAALETCRHWNSGCGVGDECFFYDVAGYEDDLRSGSTRQELILDAELFCRIICLDTTPDCESVCVACEVATANAVYDSN